MAKRSTLLRGGVAGVLLFIVNYVSCGFAWLVAIYPESGWRWVLAVLTSLVCLMMAVWALIPSQRPLASSGAPVPAPIPAQEPSTPPVWRQNNASWRPEDEEGWGPGTAEALVSGTFAPANHKVVMLSGACDGADTLFGEAALKLGHGVIHVLGPRNEPSDEAMVGQANTLLKVSDEFLDGELVSPAFERAAASRGIFPAKDENDEGGMYGTLDDWRDSRRNFVQVVSADCVFAVAYRLNPGPNVPALDIGGGTGLAVQMYVDRFKPRGPEPAEDCELYLYDDGAPGWGGCLKDPATHRKWSWWNPVTDSWVPLDSPPKLPKRSPRGSGPLLYAGIGGTRLDPNFGEKSIDNVLIDARAYTAHSPAPLAPPRVPAMLIVA